MTQTTNDANGQWAVTINSGVTTIVAQGTNTNATMQYDSTYTDYTCCASATKQAVCLYQMVTATQFATEFLSAITCDGGVTAPSTSNWAAQATIFASLSTVVQNQLKEASSNASGTTVEQCVARYDFIIIKYTTTNYANFMSRTVASGTDQNAIDVGDRVNNATLIIVVVSIAAVSAIACVEILHKRKAK